MTEPIQREFTRLQKRQQAYKAQRDSMEKAVKALLDLPFGLTAVLEAADALNQAAAREAADAYALVTRWAPNDGPVREHVYGPYTRRSEAHTAGRSMLRSEHSNSSGQSYLVEGKNRVLTERGTLTYRVHKMVDERKWDQE